MISIDPVTGIHVADWSGIDPAVIARHRAEHATRVAATRSLPVSPSSFTESAADLAAVAGKSLALVVTGRNPLVTDEVCDARRAQCAGCEHNTQGRLPRCKLCNCVIAAMTRLVVKKCKAGKW